MENTFADSDIKIYRALVLDTETTSKYPVNAHIVQLAYMMVEYSVSGDVSAPIDYTVLETGNDIIQPYNGAIVPIASSEIHGISHRRAKIQGKPLKEALERMMLSISKHRPNVIVCHNVAYDLKVLYNAFVDVGLKHMLPLLTEQHHFLCTMMETTDWCALPHVRQREDGDPYKWPTLEELYIKLFSKAPVVKLHDALNDVDCTVKCLVALHKRGIVTETDWAFFKSYVSMF
jgi:DNA polymerase III epsilon subunit-like protein